MASDSALANSGGLDPYDEALADLGHQAESWRPGEGEQLVGAYQGRYEGPDMGYGPMPFVLLKDRDGKPWRVLLRTVLLRELTQLRPVVGDIIALAYLGKQTTTDGRPYHAYQVSIRRMTQTPEQEWGPEPEPAPTVADLQQTLDEGFKPREMSAEEARDRGQADTDDIPF